MQFLTSPPNFRGSADPPDPAFPSSWCYSPGPYNIYQGSLTSKQFIKNALPLE